MSDNAASVAVGAGGARTDAETPDSSGLGPLAEGVAADLSSLLGPVLMASNLLGERLRDGHDAAAVAMLEQSARRGGALMRQILALAGGDAASVPLVQPAQLLEEVRRLVAETFPRAIDVIVEAGADSASMRGEPMELQQVLVTLCLDARHAMPAGGRLTLGAETATSDDGTFIVLSVSDTGTAALPAVQATPARAAADAIVRAHGGFVTAEAQPGRGTVTRVHLPVAAQSPPGLEPRPPAPPRGRDELVLLVDGEASVRALTAAVLRNAGYRVEVAATGTDAVAHCARHGHDIAMVLLGTLTPAADAVNTIRALHTIDPGQRIVAAAASPGGGSTFTGVAPAIAAFLPKPYTSTALLTLVRAVLDD